MTTFSQLTKEQEHILREQVIDTEHPGPVLRDFRTLLTFVGSQELKVAGKYNLLPIDVIGQLDPLLSRPLRLERKMKRPLLRSHPYLQGLYLLLRASGLGRVQGRGAKARLVLDPALLGQWDHLNPIEQFFTLLEAWLRLSRPEIVGEWGSSLRSFVGDCLQTWRSVPPQGTRFDVDEPQEVYLFGVGRDFYKLALMDLFGLLKVDHPRHPVQPWCPAGLEHVPFGDAVFNLLGERALFSRGHEDPEDGGEEGLGVQHFGGWQSLFQPYFPEWRNNLTVEEAPPREGVFIFKVALWKVWRRIAMPASASLDALVAWILRSVHFDNDHLYAFTYRNRFGATVQVCHPAMDEGPFTDQVPIGELPLEPGQSIVLEYDFGDNWKFDVTLERIEPPGTKIKAPRIMETHGKAPKQYGDGEDW